MLICTRMNTIRWLWLVFSPSNGWEKLSWGLHPMLQNGETSVVTLVAEFKASWQAMEALLWTLPGPFLFLTCCYLGFMIRQWFTFYLDLFSCHLCSLDVHFAHLQGSHPRSPACHSGRTHQQGAFGQVPTQNSRIPKRSQTSWERRS